MTCPLFAPGLFVWMKASNGIKNAPPTTPRRAKLMITQIRDVEKMERAKKKIAMKKPAMQEIPGSTLSFDSRPHNTAPTAMPTAVAKKRYPPPTSLKCNDCIAKGMILSCVKAPTKRKKAEPKIAVIRWGTVRLVLSV